MKRCVTDAKNNQARLDRDRQDWQNLLFYRGGDHQWTIYDRGTNAYIPRGDDPEQGGLPDWVPRPVTNIFGLKIDGLCSLLNQSEPAKTWSPSTDDDADRAAAEVAGDADPVLTAECGYDVDRAELNKLACLTNGAAYILHYDNDPKYGIEEIPLLRCPTCGIETMPSELDEAGSVCPGTDDEPGCGTSADDFEPVIDSQGKPSGIPYAKGRIKGDVIPSFEYSLPGGARKADVKANAWLLTHSGMPADDVIGRWPKARELVKVAGSKKAGGVQRAMARGMRMLSSPARANAPTATSGGSGTAGDDPVIYILHHDPIDDGTYYFPDGLLSVMLEDTLLESGPLPVQDDEGRGVKSAVIRTYSQSPGTAFGKPPADDLVPLQISRNRVDSLIQLILMHDAAPRNWIPLSVTLENEPSGRPGENIYYRSTVPGEKPQTDHGVTPVDGLFKYLEIIDQKMEEISKLNAVLMGERPQGDPTLGEIQILQERGMAAFKEPFDQLVQFETDLSRLLMWIAKRSAWSNRFRRMRGENGDWDIKQFNAADLDGKIDVEVEKATAWPKSHMMRMLQVDKALKNGLLPNPQHDPELQAKLLEEYNLGYLKPSLDVDRKQITRELDRWKDATDPKEILPPDQTTQELPLHLFFKKQFLKTEEFEDLKKANAPLAAAMVSHVQQIQQLVSATAGPKSEAAKTSFVFKDLTDPDARKLFEQENNLPATPPPAPPAATDPRSAVEKGDTSAIDHAVHSGALQPAGGQPKHDALGHAVAAGALTPASAVPAPVHQGPGLDHFLNAGVLHPAPPAPDHPTPPPG